MNDKATLSVMSDVVPKRVAAIRSCKPRYICDEPRSVPCRACAGRAPGRAATASRRDAVVVAGCRRDVEGLALHERRRGAAVAQSSCLCRSGADSLKRPRTYALVSRGFAANSKRARTMCTLGRAGEGRGHCLGIAGGRQSPVHCRMVTSRFSGSSRVAGGGRPGRSNTLSRLARPGFAIRITSARELGARGVRVLLIRPCGKRHNGVVATCHRRHLPRGLE